MPEQLSLDFEAPRTIALAESIAAELGENLRWWLLRNIALPDGFTDKSKRVSGETLSRYLQAMHTLPVPCFASADTLAARTLEGSKRPLSEKTIDNCLQALRRPLGPNQFGSDPSEPIIHETATRRHVTDKYILWQYLPCYLPPKLRPVYERKRRLAAAANRELSSPIASENRELGAANRELSSRIREPSSAIREPGSANREPGSPESVPDSGSEFANESVPLPSDDDVKDARAPESAKPYSLPRLPASGKCSEGRRGLMTG